MSLDTLFQQILLTEQQLTEQTQKFKEVKVAVIRCSEKLRSVSDRYEKTSIEVDEKAQQLSVMKLQHDLLKKREHQMLKQIEDMLCQKSKFEECLAKIKRVSKDEEEKFLQEISRFNSDFSLRGNRETVFESQTHTEILDLEREVESLYKEMELMSHRNSHISSLQEVKRALQFELQHLDNNLKGLDRQLREAEAMTEALQAELLFVSQKPLTDSACLRLRKELEMHKEGELELLRDALSSEIQFMQSKLDSSQGSEQH
ncbi:coiled-coil domain-containing protein 172 isoform X1 [Anabas testudineus]|uniref:Coiled-coil domain-containing protein 172 n=1 Tax=Anabas testudineus TaxID=64144 RepID=A0A3Q1K3G6_ANATE|nr:coiled-coil domain-containing protein 172 isoform X1 [Anabas testudineus]